MNGLQRTWRGAGMMLAHITSYPKSKLLWAGMRQRLDKAIRLAKGVRLNASFVLMRRIHEILYSTPAIEGSDDTQKQAHCIARKLCNLPPLAWVDDFANRHRQEIDDRTEGLRQHPVVRPILDEVIVANYWAASFFTVLGDKMSPDIRRALDDYEELKARRPDMSLPSEAESARIDSDFTRQVKEIVKAEHRRTAYKIDIGISELYHVIAILSPVLIAGGFIYCHIYYGYFGITTGPYFNLSDYLASSIEAIYAAGISAIIAGIGLFASIRRDSGLRPLQRPPEPGISREELPVALVVCLMLLGHIEALVIRDPASWLSLGVCIYLLLLAFVTSQLPRLFVRPLAPVVLTLFIGSFFCTLVCRAEYNARISAAGTIAGTSREQLIAADGHELVRRNDVVVGANSDYFFIWNKNTRIATAVPRREVALVHIN